MPRIIFALTLLLLLSACSTSTSIANKPKTILTQNNHSGSTYLQIMGFYRFGFNRVSQRTMKVYTVSN